MGSLSGPGLIKDGFDGKQGSLCVEGVKNGFYQEDVHPAFNQGRYLFNVGLAQLIKVAIAVARALYVRTQA